LTLRSVGYTVQDLFARNFRKLVPLKKDSKTPNVDAGGVIKIADDPQYWTAERLTQYYHKFDNVATTFGPILMPDGKVYYNNCLDVDSSTVYEILNPYLEKIKALTYLVKTKKGLHIHWLESIQHERVGNSSAGRRVKRCMAGYNFEIKTDHAGGLAHLPPSLHRIDVAEKKPQPFQYHQLEGSADKVGIIDNFDGSGLGFYDWLMQPTILGKYVKMPSEEERQQPPKINNDNSRDERQQQRQQQQERTKTNYLAFICADRIYRLVDKYYIFHHRNNLMLAITGAIRRSKAQISYDAAKPIIEEFCRIAGDCDIGERLATLRHTYDKANLNEIAGFGRLYDLVSQMEQDKDSDERNELVKSIGVTIYATLDDYAMSLIFDDTIGHPNVEINKSEGLHIIIFPTSVEIVQVTEVYNPILRENLRKAERKTLLLNAAPCIGTVYENWDPIYKQTKYSMTFQHLGHNGRLESKQLEKPLTRDELVDWLRNQAGYYHKTGKLEEAVHAIIDAYSSRGYVNHRVETEIEGLVWLPHRGLVLSKIPGPDKPSQEEARRCIYVMRQLQKQFYSESKEMKRFAHFLKVGVVAPVDFARRQSGAVNSHDIIPRQDLGGWTDSGKTFGYAGIVLRIYRMPIKKSEDIGGGTHSYIIGSGSVDTAARFIEQTRWTTMPVIFDEADRYSDWEKDDQARQILSLIKNSTFLTNPRDTLTTDSKQVLKPSCAYVMLTHNSPLIQEDGFNRRVVGHEFTVKDEKKPQQQKNFNKYWAVHGNTFGYLGDFVLNYYLEHPEVLNNHWIDIAKIILHAFYVDAAGVKEQEFQDEWDSWLGHTVESATSKSGLAETRRASVVFMLRDLVQNEGWVRNRREAATYIARNIRKLDLKDSGSDVEDPLLIRQAVDDIMTNATFSEKVEALVKMGALPYLMWHDGLKSICIDSSIVGELRSRHITRVSHRNLSDLLGFGYGSARFGDDVKKVVHATLDEFVARISPDSS
jgi:hypothetical protein